MSDFYTRSEINLRKGQVKFYFTELLSQRYAQLRSAQRKFGIHIIAADGFKDSSKTLKRPKHHPFV